ncbi:MAG TPA: helix-turn-helix domain-containing protein [Bryobacteraceae bacterium]|nr:helix-turn-helix domain-containing protein [Bryobacteraceae bacterium]
MIIRRAVSLLRKKAGLDQAEFAKLTGTTVETVSRWENGHRAPNIDTLKKLGAVAEAKGHPELRDVFESKWKKRIADRIGNLPSKGTQRRLSLEDLKYNAAISRYLDDDLSKILSRFRKQIPTADEDYPWLTWGLQNALFLLGRQLEEIELHIDQPYGHERTEEDEKLLRRQPKSTYGIQGLNKKKGSTHETK